MEKSERSVVVYGIPESVTDKILTMYFQKKKNGGGEVEEVVMIPDEKTAKVVFKDKRVIYELLKKEHWIQGQAVDVKLESPDSDGKTIMVSNLPDGMSKNKLKMHFQKRKNSGGAIQDVSCQPDAKVAWITFKDAEVAQAVVKAEQKIGEVILATKLLGQNEQDREEDSGAKCENLDGKQDRGAERERRDPGVESTRNTDRVRGQHLSGRERSTKTDKQDAKSGNKDGTVYKEKENNVDPRSATELDRTIVVSNIPVEVIEKEVLLYFGKRANDGGEVANAKLFPEERKALVVFEDVEVADRVILKNHYLKDQPVAVEKYKQTPDKIEKPCFGNILWYTPGLMPADILIVNKDILWNIPVDNIFTTVTAVINIMLLQNIEPQVWKEILDETQLACGIQWHHAAYGMLVTGTLEQVKHAEEVLQTKFDVDCVGQRGQEGTVNNGYVGGMNQSLPWGSQSNFNQLKSTSEIPNSQFAAANQVQHGNPVDAKIGGLYPCLDQYQDRAPTGEGFHNVNAPPGLQNHQGRTASVQGHTVPSQGYHHVGTLPSQGHGVPTVQACNQGRAFHVFPKMNAPPGFENHQGPSPTEQRSSLSHTPPAQGHPVPSQGHHIVGTPLYQRYDEVSVPTEQVNNQDRAPPGQKSDNVHIAPIQAPTPFAQGHHPVGTPPCPGYDGASLPTHQAGRTSPGQRSDNVPPDQRSPVSHTPPAQGTHQGPNSAALESSMAKPILVAPSSFTSSVQNAPPSTAEEQININVNGNSTTRQFLGSQSMGNNEDGTQATRPTPAPRSNQHPGPDSAVLRDEQRDVDQSPTSGMAERRKMGATFPNSTGQNQTQQTKQASSGRSTPDAATNSMMDFGTDAQASSSGKSEKGQGLKNENLEGDKAGHTGSSVRRNRGDPREYEVSDASRPEADAAANKEPWPGISVAQFIHTVYADDLETFKSQNYVDVELSEDKQMLTLLPMRRMSGPQLEEVRFKFQAFYETTSKNLTTGTFDLSGYPRDEAEQIKKSMRQQKGKNDVMVAETGENNDVYTVVGQAENIEMFRRNVMGHRVHGASPTQRAPDDGGSMVTTRKGVRVVLAMGALEKQDSEAIVNFTDNELAHKKGLSGAIREAAGAPFWNECRQIISRNGALVAGMVTVTTAGELPSRYVMNAILGDMSKERRQEALRHHLEEICRQVLLQATEKNLQSISFPIITPDIANLLTPVSSRLLLQVIKNFIETQSSIEGNTLKEIRIVYLKNSKDAESFKKEFQLQF